MACDTSAERGRRIEAFYSVTGIPSGEDLRQVLLGLLAGMESTPAISAQEELWRSTMRKHIAHRALHLDISLASKAALVERAWPGDWRAGLEKAYFAVRGFERDEPVSADLARSRQLVRELIDHANSVAEADDGDGADEAAQEPKATDSG
jgi:hypothetical protein